MKEVIFVLLNGFADWEGAFTAICLNQGVKPGNPINYKVKYLSITKEPVTSIGGLRVLPDYDLKDMPEDYAGLILIGGMRWFSPEAELKHSKIRNWLLVFATLLSFLVCMGSLMR